jgi:hypothetical protein
LSKQAHRVTDPRESDFLAVIGFFEQSGLVPTNRPKSLITTARKMHAATYSLMLWPFYLKKIPVQGIGYLQELGSDSLHVLPMSLTGYRKAALLYLRGSIEDVVRHFYFTDHPVEYQKLNQEKKWYISTADLFEYLRTHPVFQDSEIKFDGIGRLKNLYGELSADVHGGKLANLDMRKALQQIKLDESEFDRQTKVACRCAEAINFLLLVFYRQQAHTFPHGIRSAIVKTIPSRARKVWRELS